MCDNRPIQRQDDNGQPPPSPSAERRSTSGQGDQRRETRRWWIKLVLQPVLFVGLMAALIVALGVAQRLGWISGGGDGNAQASASAQAARYICPMMCTPPQSEPGRCPVCAMELVPATSAGGGGKRYVEIDPAARRIAKIQTAKVSARQLARTVRAIGEIRYDEGSLKTISAYVDGRIERLYADYTGVVVRKDDHLALVYSPKLYSGQVELLLAREARANSENSTLKHLIKTNQDIYESARRRLVELGMTEQQIGQLEQEAKPNSRLHLCAPIGGTVIEKFAIEGQYVKEGQPIYKLADLSTVWLMLELFPEDAAAIRYGQRVDAVVRSLPGESFSGRVAFIDPNVDPLTQTVGVRVVIANADGRIRIGDYAKATIDVQVGDIVDGGSEAIYDPELAGKFVSPRHPHIISDKPGVCPICGIELVPASELGYSDQPVERTAFMVPRDAVLMAGANSVVYVETQPGRFEIRNVVLGPSRGDEIVILDGVQADEHVATRGNFLIDSQMQLAGNPSLIDPSKASPTEPELSGKSLEVLAKLSDEDRALAVSQRICPVTEMELGSMGAPIKVRVSGQDVFICCEGCRSGLLKDAQSHLAKLKEAASEGGQGDQTPTMDLPPMGEFELASPEPDMSPTDDSEEVIAAAFAKLAPADRELARRQKMCPVAEMPLGSMGVPIRVDVKGRPVFICCEGCREPLLAKPQKHLARLPKGVVR